MYHLTFLRLAGFKYIIFGNVSQGSSTYYFCDCVELAGLSHHNFFCVPLFFKVLVLIRMLKDDELAFPPLQGFACVLGYLVIRLVRKSALFATTGCRGQLFGML